MAFGGLGEVLHFRNLIFGLHYTSKVVCFNHMPVAKDSTNLQRRSLD